MATYARVDFIREVGWVMIKKVMKLKENNGNIDGNACLRIVAGGDVCLDPQIRSVPHFGAYGLIYKFEKYRVLKKLTRKLTRMLCKMYFLPNYFYSLRDVQFLEPLSRKNQREGEKEQKLPYEDSEQSHADAKYSRPFRKIAPFLKKRDLAVVNLETPLSTSNRAHGFFISEPSYAKIMKEAGISLVSLANNHIFDAGEVGFKDTIRYLDEAEVCYTGGGGNLEEARLGRLLMLNGVKVVFLGYTQWCNHRYSSIAADYPGILPLDRKLILEDIRMAKAKANLVFVCLHWGYENQPRIHHTQVEIAHSLIDGGADAIIGHHPHVPHAIEVYKKRPILYSLGNFIFAQGPVKWPNDNYLGEFIIKENSIQGIIIHPISGRWPEVSQPELLSGDRAEKMLYDLQLKSAVFNTKMGIKNSVGYINI
jgi:poly-gamma-glutamate synthesis protein (capsule biosynthesis protein)